MDKYIEAEKRLAELLGWDGLTIGQPTYGPGPAICLQNPHTGALLTAAIPAWCRDDAAAFRLMVEHKAEVTPYPNKVVASVFMSTGTWESVEFYNDHVDEITAARSCIVYTVIAKLEAKG